MSVAGQGLQTGAAENIEDQIEEVDTTVDENTAARLLLDGEGTAQAGDGAEGAEGAINVIDVAEFSFPIQLLQHFLHGRTFKVLPAPAVITD